jgi:hypothetical protein
MEKSSAATQGREDQIVEQPVNAEYAEANAASGALLLQL